MENRKKKRCTYLAARQKKKLIELMTKYPELISCKVTHDFNYKDSQRLWQNIANECNSIPGAKKTWRQWRKTWHDLRSKAKQRVAKTNGELNVSSITLTSAEEEALGIKAITSTDKKINCQETPELVMMDENQQENLCDELSTGTLSEPESPIDTKVFTAEPGTKKVKMKNLSKHGSKQASCYFNCDLIAVQEQRKIQIKEDYLSFKKDYLRQKLLLLKEQTEALKCIAKDLCK